MVLVLWSGSGKCAVLLLCGMGEGATVALQPEHQKNLPETTGQEPSVSMGRLGGTAMLTDFPVPSLALGLTVSWLLKVRPVCTSPA